MFKPRILSHGKVQWNFFMRYPLSKRVMASPDCKKVLKINFARYTLLNVTNYLHGQLFGYIPHLNPMNKGSASSYGGYHMNSFGHLSQI